MITISGVVRRMMNNMSKNLFQKALEFASRGYSIFPVGIDKKPLIVWKPYQTTPATDSEIEAWWQKFPKANIGIVTGKISGITVVDIDVKGDKVTSLETFPETFTVRTPSLGYHLYYQYDADIKQTANTFPQFPHVDIRNDGGYVVGPPSELPNGKYEIIKNLPLVPFPRNLFLKEKKTVKTSLKDLGTLKEGDGRNNELTKIVGGFIARMDPKDYETVAYPMVLAANSHIGQPLSEKEVRTIFESITKRESAKPKLLENKQGIIANEENVCRTIEMDELLRGKFRYNTFTGQTESCFEADGWHNLQRSDIVDFRTYLMRTYPYFSKIPHQMAEDSIMRYANRQKVSPPVEWLKSLVWDKTPRLDSWLSKTYNVPSALYYHRVGANWLKGLVKRLVLPGCKFDFVLVLEGPQGIGKSTSFSILGKEWYVETSFTPDNKDFFMLFSGKAIVEFSEGETLSRTEAKHLKAIITMQIDKYRPPYERASKEFPRQCVFAMTTNQDQYLKDETGNRRWLPVRCKGTINTEWLEENRDQLFAEAYHRVINLKETIYEFPEEALREEQEMRRVVDPNEDLVIEWYFKKLGDFERERGITTRQAWFSAICGGTTFGKDMSKMDEIRVGGILKSQLCLERSRAREKGELIYKYYPTQESKKLAPKNKTLEMDIFTKEVEKF